MEDQIIEQEQQEQNPDNSYEVFEKTFEAADNTKIDAHLDEEIKDEVKQDIPNVDIPKKGVKLGSVISGKTTVKVTDIFIPSLLVFLINKAGYKADKNKFRLTKEEQDVLNPVVQDCLDYIVIDFANPFYTLALVAGLIYGSKILDVIPETKKIMEEIKEETNEQEIEQETDLDYTKKIQDELISEPLRKEKNKIIIREIENITPENFTDCFRQYLKIYPTRSETTFKSWYKNNIDSFQDQYKFELPE